MAFIMATNKSKCHKTKTAQHHLPRTAISQWRKTLGKTRVKTVEKSEQNKKGNQRYCISLIPLVFFGAGDGTRTRDRLITNHIITS